MTGKLSRFAKATLRERHRNWIFWSRRRSTSRIKTSPRQSLRPSDLVCSHWTSGSWPLWRTQPQNNTMMQGIVNQHCEATLPIVCADVFHWSSDHHLWWHASIWVMHDWFRGWINDRNLAGSLIMVDYLHRLMLCPHWSDRLPTQAIMIMTSTRLILISAITTVLNLTFSQNVLASEADI